MSVRITTVLAAVAASLITVVAAVPAVAAPATAFSATAVRPVIAATGARVEADAPATVSVTGEGSATAAPDTAIVTAGVEVTEPTAERALTAGSAAARALLDAVRAQGVADRDVRTEALLLSAVRAYAENGTSEVTGHQAAQTFSIRVRDLDKAPSIVQAVTDATGDAGRVHGISFDVADPAALRARARAAAHRDARDEAGQHARLSGHELGRLVSLTEGASGGSRPVESQVTMLDGKAKMPVAPGEIREEVVITAVYELR